VTYIQDERISTLKELNQTLEKLITIRQNLESLSRAAYGVSVSFEDICYYMKENPKLLRAVEDTVEEEINEQINKIADLKG